MSLEIDEGLGEVYEETQYRARKEYRCSSCRETSRRGDRYRRTFVVHEGEPETYRHCLRCGALLDVLVSEHRKRDTGQAPDITLGCGHSWQEVFEDEPPAAVMRLAFMTRDEAQFELGRMKEENPEQSRFERGERS